MQTPGKQMQELDWFSSPDFQAAFVTVTGKGRHGNGPLSSLRDKRQFLVWMFPRALSVGNAVMAT